MDGPPTPEQIEAFAAMDRFTEELVKAGVFVDEAMAWAKRAPNPMPGKKNEMEIRPFYEAEDLAEFMTPEELAAPRTGDRGKLGVA